MKKLFHSLFIKIILVVTIVIFMGQVTFDVDIKMDKARFSVLESIGNLVESSINTVKWAKKLGG